MNDHQIDKLALKVDRRLRAGKTASALRILQDNGFTDEAKILEQPAPLVRHDLRCPAHHATVAAPCRLNRCKFWVQSQMANNCLLAYCHHQQIDRLSPDEIAYLYGQDVVGVSTEIEQAMSTLRVTAIQNDSIDDPDIQRVFWFVETQEVCCVCGSQTDGDRISVPDHKLAYCSRDCLDQSPPDVISCEARFGRPIETVLRWALHRFRNLPALERTLGLKRETLIRLARQLLGRDLTGFFPKAKMQNETKPWRRPNPPSIGPLSAYTDQMTARAGKAIFGLDLRDQLAVLI